MSDHNGSWRSFNDQFRETPGERNERLREARDRRRIESLLKLVTDLSDALTDEGPDWSFDGLDGLRRRVANAVPREQCPDWLHEFRDPQLVRS